MYGTKLYDYVMVSGSDGMKAFAASVMEDDVGPRGLRLLILQYERTDLLEECVRLCKDFSIVEETNEAF